MANTNWTCEQASHQMYRQTYEGRGPRTATGGGIWLAVEVNWLKQEIRLLVFNHWCHRRRGAGDDLLEDSPTCAATR
ncbi:hypothetical protein EVAR_68588_1 [Eumeta japonica]|uniref:Uncharacterized protein n=1 Tax=Eumeta variegata TaxID=151549 RepID=A0A4C2A8U3_EUMVA|nr:hypothetical protein EVAR_68588_1 [Eumeta japonica]